MKFEGIRKCPAMGQIALPTNFFLIFLIFLNNKIFILGFDEISTPKMELHTPLIHYIFSGELRLSYRILSVLPPSEHYLADLVESLSNVPVHSENLTLTPINTWSILDMPCSLLISPGKYVIKIRSLSEAARSDLQLHSNRSEAAGQLHSNLSKAAGQFRPEIVSKVIEIRWLAAVDWSLSPGIIRLFTDALTVNISLHSPTVCPQQEPGKNFTLAINLIYKPNSGTPVEIAWRGLQWPFGTTRSPRNSSILFPCQLFDRTGGAYYATLTLMRSGRKPVILGESSLVPTTHNQSDYSLLINGDVRKCRKNAVASGNERTIRVSYRAPVCTGADKIRLYRIESGPVNFPKNLKNTNQTYLMERSVRSRPRAASFNYPCHIFTAQQDALGFCWIYTSSSRDGQTKELSETRQCFPFSDAAMKVWKLTDTPKWSDWTPWTTCTQTCRKGHSHQAVRMRSRVCLRNSNGIFRYTCEGKSIETKLCKLPLCHGFEGENDFKIFDKIFLWFPTFRNQTSEMSNRTSIFVHRFYESDAENVITGIQINQQFFFFVISTLGFFLLMLFCCVFPDFWKLFCKKARLREKASIPNDPNRDSHYALISKEDEPTTTTLLTTRQRPLHGTCDQPSRSGVLEMQIISSVKEKTEEISVAEKKWPILVPSPLILQKICRIQKSKKNDFDNQSGRSSSNLSTSSRPDPGDVDFEYDDFIPDKLVDEEEIWTPQHLDIKIFATAYEDIVKELNNSRDESNL